MREFTKLQYFSEKNYEKIVFGKIVLKENIHDKYEK